MQTVPKIGHRFLFNYLTAKAGRVLLRLSAELYARLPRDTEEGAGTCTPPPAMFGQGAGHMENRLTAAVIHLVRRCGGRVELTDTRLVLYSSDYGRRIILAVDYIKDAMRELFEMDVELVVLGEGTRWRPTVSRPCKKPEFIEFNPQFTFDRFVVGSSNRFARGGPRRGKQSGGDDITRFHLRPVWPRETSAAPSPT